MKIRYNKNKNMQNVYDVYTKYYFMDTTGLDIKKTRALHNIDKKKRRRAL